MKTLMVVSEDVTHIHVVPDDVFDRLRHLMGQVEESGEWIDEINTILDQHPPLDVDGTLVTWSGEESFVIND